MTRVNGLSVVDEFDELLDKEQWHLFLGDELFISVIFPVADFRSLHPESVGRLENPKWGEQEPQAKFARGFGSIHFRNKSAVGFAGENYYADCERLVRYSNQTFISALDQQERTILAYPIFRRFYFDGQMSGRFEFGFRLNEPSIYDIEMKAKSKGETFSYNATSIIAQILKKRVVIGLVDGRIEECELFRISKTLRDAYLISSTKSNMMNQYGISGLGADFVEVGRPYAFLRSGYETPLSTNGEYRELFAREFSFLGARSGVQNREIDCAIIVSRLSILQETAKERLARLLYTQMRAVAYSHSFYLRQIDNGKLTGNSPLNPTILALLNKLRDLAPNEENESDVRLCHEMSEIIRNSDIDPIRMAEEINKRLKTTLARKIFTWFAKNIDRKTDVAIEAAASTVTRYAITGGQ